MKTIAAVIIILTIGISTSKAQPSTQIPLKRIEKYDKIQQGTLTLETNFGSPVILNKSDIQQLKGKKIYHVDLVYTKYREAEDFDQNELNLNRIAQLESIIPEVKEQKPDWTAYEQTGATEREDAKTYFHGFVVHYGDDIAYKAQQQKANELRVPFSEIGIDNQKGGNVEYYTGSRIQMMPDAVYYKNGDLVEGRYILKYREFRDQADIATSGIPMFYTEHGNKDEIFNSTGMFEIRAFKDGEELVLKKDAIINFRSTKVLEGVNYYALDEEGNWTQEGIISTTETSETTSEETYDIRGNNSGNFISSTLSTYVVVKGVVGTKLKFQKYVPQDELDQGAYQGQTRVKYIKAKDYNQIKITFQDDQQLRWFRKGLLGKKSPIRDMSRDLDTLGIVKTVLVFAEDSVEFIEYMCGAPYDQLVRTTEDSKSVNEDDFTVYTTKDYGPRVDSQLVYVTLPEIPPVAGLVYGLRAKNFGVYNCDQTRRLQEPVALKPIYYDKESKEKIENLFQTCVIDLNINASLSYHPNHIYYSPKGKTKLLIFTTDNQVYFANKSTVDNIDHTVEIVDLEVENVSDRVKNLSDLKKLIGV